MPLLSGSKSSWQRREAAGKSPSLLQHQSPTANELPSPPTAEIEDLEQEASEPSVAFDLKAC